MEDNNTPKIDIQIFNEEMPPLEKMIKSIERADCGGISIFQGVTRNNFNGKKVEKLIYEAYEDMAKKEMHKIALEAIDKFQVKGVALWHRLGEV